MTALDEYQRKLIDSNETGGSRGGGTEPEPAAPHRRASLKDMKTWDFAKLNAYMAQQGVAGML